MSPASKLADPKIFITSAVTQKNLAAGVVTNNNIDLQQLPTANFIGNSGNHRRRDDGSEFTALFAYTKRACCP